MKKITGFLSIHYTVYIQHCSFFICVKPIYFLMKFFFYYGLYIAKCLVFVSTLFGINFYKKVVKVKKVCSRIFDVAFFVTIKDTCKYAEVNSKYIYF